MQLTYIKESQPRLQTVCTIATSSHRLSKGIWLMFLDESRLCRPWKRTTAAYREAREQPQVVILSKRSGEWFGLQVLDSRF